MQALRMGDWKGVRVGKNAPLELYHLKRDPSETKNVAAEYPRVVARIEELMKSARTESEDYPIGDMKSKRR
jgi:arylsulfatase A-like enzyme